MTSVASLAPSVMMTSTASMTSRVPKMQALYILSQIGAKSRVTKKYVGRLNKTNETESDLQGVSH